ncbi:MAG: universal stress protein [Rubricoccaceae bacterium]|nr:universal stress protein [Rubricoccaceae bacterium]
MVPTDFSPCAERAQQYARQLASEESEILLVHVLAFPHDWFYWDVPSIESLRSDVEKAAQDQLDERAHVLTEAGLRVKTFLKASSHTSHALIEEIEARSPSMVVVGTKGWADGDANAHYQMGSVAEQILRGSGVPVLVVPPGATGLSSHPNILVPLEASETGNRGLVAGRDIVSLLNGTLTVLHVLGSGRVGSAYLGGEPVEAEDDIEPVHRMRNLRSFIEKAIGEQTEMSLELAEGDFAEEVSDYAERNRIDFIVLSRSTKADHIHKAEKLARKLTCPVLVVPSGGDVVEDQNEGRFEPQATELI